MKQEKHWASNHLVFWSVGICVKIVFQLHRRVLFCWKENSSNDANNICVGTKAEDHTPPGFLIIWLIHRAKKKKKKIIKNPGRKLSTLRKT